MVCDMYSYAKVDGEIITAETPTRLIIAKAGESEHVVGDRPTAIDHDWPNMDSLNNVAATVSTIVDIDASGTPRRTV